MNESITRAAGALHGEEMSPEAMEQAIDSCGRRPRQRTTLYAGAPAKRTAASFGAAPLRPVPVTPVSQQKRDRQTADLTRADA